MKVIPSITIKQGHVAVAESGQYVYLRNDQGQYRNPVNVVKEMEAPGDQVFVLDIDGLERNSPDLDTVKRISAYREVWADAGTGDADSMMDLFVAGASRVVLGTLCLENLEELEDALDISDDVIFSVGYDGNVVSPDREMVEGGLEALALKLREMGARCGILMDLGSIREERGINMAAVRILAGAFEEFYVSGNVSREDMGPLEEAGATGVIMDFRKIEGEEHG